MAGLSGVLPRAGICRPVPTTPSLQLQDMVVLQVRRWHYVALAGVTLGTRGDMIPYQT